MQNGKEIDRTLQIEGVEEDDPTIEDEDILDPSLFAQGDDEDEYGEVDSVEDEGEDDGEDPGVDATQEHGQEQADVQAVDEQRPQGQYLTQADVDRIVERRLSRDRKARTVREIESIIGKSLEEFKEEVLRQKAEEVADRYGLSEDEARQFVEQQAQIFEFQRRQKELEEQQKMIQAKLDYLEHKRRAMGDPKRAQLIRQFEAEIDKVADEANVPFDVAVRYVLGDKLLSGDLGSRLEDAAKQKVLRGGKDNAAAPVSARAGGAKGTTLTPVERALAKAFGIPANEWAEEKAKIRRSR